MIKRIMLRRARTLSRHFCTSKQPKISPQLHELAQQSTNYPPQTKQKLSTLSTLITQLIHTLPLHTKISQNSTLLYVSLLCRSHLIAAPYIPSTQYSTFYPTMKKILNSEKYRLSPRTCTALTQWLSLVRFEGDQGRLVGRLCRYYEEYCELFRQDQEAAFWEFYMRIMAEKVHNSVKFINLKRRSQQTIEFASIKQIVQKSLPQNPNPKILKNLQFTQTEATLTLTKPSPSPSPSPNSKPLTLIISLKGLTNFNEFPYNPTENNRQLMEYMMREVKSVENSVRKGWRVVLHGCTEPAVGGRERYRYRVQGEGEGEGVFVRSQRVEEIGDIGEKELNDGQWLDKLRASNRYVQGIFYNSTNPNIRRIDTLTTLLLSLPHRLPHSSLHFHQQHPPQTPLLLSPYLSLPQIKQLYGYKQLCKFHNKLYKTYRQVQSLVLSLQDRRKEEKYGVDLLREVMEIREMDEVEGRKFLADNGWVMADMVVGEKGVARGVRLQGGYDRGWAEVNQLWGNYAAQMCWQMRPFFADVLRIIALAEKLESQASSQNPQGQTIKIKLITSKYNIPYLVQHLTEGKFWTVPKLPIRSKQQQQAKELLLGQLLKKSSTALKQPIPTTKQRKFNKK